MVGQFDSSAKRSNMIEVSLTASSNIVSVCSGADQLDHFTKLCAAQDE
jgi:hypothetical protein